MKIPSVDIPQANAVDEVIQTVVGVQRGNKTDIAIAAHLGKVDRQGRYYRRAAEILGLISAGPGANNSLITKRGLNLLGSDGEGRKELLAEAILSARIFQRVLPFLEIKGEKGVTKAELDAFIAGVTEPVGPSMIPRRRSTIINWLVYVGIAREHEDRVYITRKIPNIEAIEYEAIDEPLVPDKYDLREYQQVTDITNRTRGAVTAMIDGALLERANKSHRHLVNCVAEKLRVHGAIPRFNKFVDLSAIVQGTPFLFEMKSSTADNFRSQFRRAVSQLYEYRYLQRAENARLVVVMESHPALQDEWLMDYGVKDRGLLIAWNGNGDALTMAHGCQEELKFLA